MVLILLSILWVAVLVPPWLKNRGNRAARPVRSDGQSIAMHHRQLNVLNTALTPGAVSRENVIPFRRPEAGAPVSSALQGPTVVQRSFAGLAEPAAEFNFGPTAEFATSPMTTEVARRRRRNVLAGLGALALVTLVAAIVFGGTMLVLLNLVADVAFLGYVFLLVKHHQRQMEQANKVRPIRPAGYQPKLQSAPDYLVRSSSAR